MKTEKTLNKIYATTIALLILTLILGSAWASRTITPNKETVTGTYYYNGNYDFINDTNFNLTNKIYNSKGHIWNTSTANLKLAINDLNGTTTGTVWVPNGVSFTGVTIKANVTVIGTGNMTENYGNTSVANNGTITHGLSTTPTMIQLTSAQENLTAIVTTITSTTFKVMLVSIQTGSPPGGSYYVHWYARV